MPENPTATSGPSLEQILWRSMDRFREEPAVVDAEEFAEHIAHAFDEVVPEEAFAERFFHGDETLHRRPATLAESVVRSAGRRLHVYEFDLSSLEYVIVEDEDKLVVVSEFGQFAFPSEDAVRRALEAAVVKAPEHKAAGPRAYFVRKGGEVVGVDANQVARTLDRLAIRQVSAPAVAEPARRLAVFHPVRIPMTEAREEQALRQDPRFLTPPRAAPPRAETPRVQAPQEPRAGQQMADEGMPSRARAASQQTSSARTIQPATPAKALFLLLPDGSMAQARIGAAHRFEQMLADRAQVAARSVAVEAGDVVAIVNGTVRGSPGERALAQGEAIAAVRSADAPVRALAGDDVARELVWGARVVPAVGEEDRYWVQPERAFRPEAEAPRKTIVATPLELGQITGDPWADWALTVSEARPLAAMSPRGQAGMAPSLATGPRLLRTEAMQLELGGRPVVAFRAPDGTILASKTVIPVRLAAWGRPDAPVALRTSVDPLPRSGAMPLASLQALRTALERTAAAGAYRLPHTAAGDGRDQTGPFSSPAIAAAETEQQLVLSMPFADRGALHVGQELNVALDTLLAAPVVITGPAVAAPLFAVEPAPGSFSRAQIAAEAPDAHLPRMPAPQRAVSSEPPSWALREEALQSARRAILTLDLPAVQPLLGHDPSISGVPFLLRRAVAESEGWTLATGLPDGARQLAVRAPFSDVQVSPEPARRAPELGEEEIVIPLPLWAQMGRGAVGETERIMAAPLAPAGFAPPLGAYRLVPPGGGPLDLSGRASPYARIVEVAGPTSVRLAPRSWGTVTATTLGGRYSLAKVPLDEAGSSEMTRGRIRIGEPLQGSQVPELVSAARELREAETHPQLPLAAGAARAGPGVAATGEDRPRTVEWIQVSGAPRTAPASSPAAALPAETRFISGLPPGMWSGHRPASTADHELWTYGFTHRDQPQSVGGVRLSSFARPVYPQLPIGLRFRFAAAPLWWSNRTREAPFEVAGEGRAPSDALREGLRAANTAASLWRSILVAGAPQEQASSTMDAGRDTSAAAMSSVARKLDAVPALAATTAVPPPVPAAAPAYIAMSSSGAAGAVPAAAAAQAQGQSVEMSIVAAIPPAPPPLESMSSVPRGGDAPHARVRTEPQHDAQGQAKESEDAVSHSKIEGSVDAIAQRIYHRIRRRIQSDRERFGG